MFAISVGHGLTMISTGSIEWVRQNGSVFQRYLVYGYTLREAGYRAADKGGFSDKLETPSRCIVRPVEGPQHLYFK